MGAKYGSLCGCTARATAHAIPAVTADLAANNNWSRLTRPGLNRSGVSDPKLRGDLVMPLSLALGAVTENPSDRRRGAD
jgi:hypothetical protein